MSSNPTPAFQPRLGPVRSFKEGIEARRDSDKARPSATRPPYSVRPSGTNLAFRPFNLGNVDNSRPMYSRGQVLDIFKSMCEVIPHEDETNPHPHYKFLQPRPEIFFDDILASETPLVPLNFMPDIHIKRTRVVPDKVRRDKDVSKTVQPSHSPDTIVPSSEPNTLTSSTDDNMFNPNQTPLAYFTPNGFIPTDYMKMTLDNLLNKIRPPPIVPPTNDDPSVEIWTYIDLQNNQQGPYSALQMREWYNHGYFHLDLLIRCSPDSSYFPLRTWIANKFLAFLEEIPENLAVIVAQRQQQIEQAQAEIAYLKDVYSKQCAMMQQGIFPSPNPYSQYGGMNSWGSYGAFNPMSQFGGFGMNNNNFGRYTPGGWNATSNSISSMSSGVMSDMSGLNMNVGSSSAWGPGNSIAMSLATQSNVSPSTQTLTPDETNNLQDSLISDSFITEDPYISFSAARTSNDADYGMIPDDDIDNLASLSPALTPLSDNDVDYEDELVLSNSLETEVPEFIQPIQKDNTPKPTQDIIPADVFDSTPISISNSPRLVPSRPPIIPTPIRAPIITVADVKKGIHYEDDDLIPIEEPSSENVDSYVETSEPAPVVESTPKKIVIGPAPIPSKPAWNKKDTATVSRASIAELQKEEEENERVQKLNNPYVSHTSGSRGWGVIAKATTKSFGEIQAEDAAESLKLLSLNKSDNDKSVFPSLGTQASTASTASTVSSSSKPKTGWNTITSSHVPISFAAKSNSTTVIAPSNHSAASTYHSTAPTHRVTKSGWDVPAPVRAPIVATPIPIASSITSPPVPTPSTSSWKMSSEFEQWTREQFKRLVGYSDNALEIVTSITDNNLIEETILDLTGDVAFAKEFIQYKEFDSSNIKKGNAPTKPKPTQATTSTNRMSTNNFSVLADDNNFTAVPSRKNKKRR